MFGYDASMACRLRICLLVGGSVAAAMFIAGCKDHTGDVVGVWDWGTYAVHFDADKSWGATDKKRSSFERMGGDWTASGDKIHLNYAGGPTPNPDGSTFIMSADGQSMEASIGAMGTMVKRHPGASSDVNP